jgi:sugar-specific transcriptional regulator TrmB
MNTNLPLEILGLNYTEMKAYTTLLQMGSGTIGEIVHKAGIKRTTTYSVLENLIQKKLVSLIEKSGKREYRAEDPKKIPGLFESQEKELTKKKQRMLEMLPELSSMYNAHATKPKISFYEGEEAIKSAFDETLELPEGSEVLSYTNSEELTADYMQEFVLDYMEQRTRKKISNRAIAEDSPFVRKVQKEDKAQLRNMILVDPKKYPCADRINIYGNKVSIISFKNKLVVTVESESVAKTFNSLFELAWLGAQKTGKS